MCPSGDDATRIVEFCLPPSLSAITSRYEIIAEAGRGGMGVVYKTRDRQTKDIVAVKVLHPSIASESGLIERFKNELLLARRVTHKNVCRVYDLNDFGGTTVIAMEFVDGESLLEMLGQAQGVSIRHGLLIARQVIAGLAEAHAQGVVHRDLKPANILVGRDGNVKVMDFGIARSMHSQETSAGLIIGTPAYMSPEQAEGRQPDARSDIYSLGVVLFELFAGEPVFTADNTAAMIAKHVHERPRSPRALEPDLPVRIEDAILKCLEKNPDKRFQSVAELDAALAEQPAGQMAPSTDAAVPLPSHLTRFQRSDLVLIAAAVVGLALFFPSFARTSLAPGSQLTFDRSLQRRIAQDHLQRLGVSASGERSAYVYGNEGAYVYLAKEHGHSVARGLANNPVPYWRWSLMFQNGAVVTVNSRGELTYAFRPTALAESNSSPQPDAKTAAESALIYFWKLPISSLVLESASAGGQGSLFQWLNPSSPHGLVERYWVRSDSKGIMSLQTFVGAPDEYELNDINWGTPVATAMAITLAVLGFLQRHRVDPAARWRAVLGVAAFLGGVVYVLLLWSLSTLRDYLVFALGFGLVCSIGWLLSSITVELQIRKTQPARLHSLIGILERRATSEPCGLSILRGTLIGIALLGLDAFAIWLATIYVGVYLDPFLHIEMAARTLNRWPVAAILTRATIEAFGTGLLVAFVASIGERLFSRSWLRSMVPAVLLAISGIHFSMASIQPYYWMVSLLLLDYFILVLAFRRFDLLTLCVAVFTFAFCWGNYPLLVMLEPIGAIWQVTAFVTCGVLVAAAAAVAFQSTLRPAFQRMTTSLD